MPTAYERIADRFIDADKEVKGLFAPPKRERQETPFSDYFREQEERQERERPEEERRKVLPPPYFPPGFKPPEQRGLPIELMKKPPISPVTGKVTRELSMEELLRPELQAGWAKQAKRDRLNRELRSETGVAVEEWESFVEEYRESFLKPGEYTQVERVDDKRRVFIRGEPMGVFERFEKTVTGAVVAPLFSVGGVDISVADLTAIGLIAYGGYEVARMGWQKFLEASLTRNLKSWAKSTGKVVPKETSDTFVFQAMRTLDKKFLSQQAMRTLFKPTKAGEIAPKVAERVFRDANETTSALARTFVKRLPQFTPSVTAVPGQTRSFLEMQRGVAGQLGAKPPGIPPEAPMVTPEPFAPPPRGELMANLQDFSEVVEIASKPDAWRSIANLPVIRNVMNIFGPAATADTPAKWAVIGRAMLRHEGQQKAQGVISFLNRLGSQESVFGKLDDKGLLAEGPLKGLNLNTVRTYPKRYATKLTANQRQWIEQASQIEKEKLDFLRRNDIEIRELSFEEGGEYAGRRVFAKIRIVEGEPEILELGFVGIGPGRPGAKLSAEKHRIFETPEEAIEQGFRYLPEDEALYLNVSGAYNRVADKQMADWLLLKVPWRTTGAPEELKLASFAAKQKFNKAKILKASINRAVRGERVPDSTINSIAEAYPEQANRLRALIPQIQAEQHTAKEVQALTREVNELIHSTGNEWRLARSATARAREKAMVTVLGEARISAPAFAGKILTGPEAKETARVVMESLEPSFSKALGAVNKVNAVARYFMLAGDFSVATIQLLFFMGSNPIVYSKACAGMVKGIFDPKFHDNYLANHNDTIQKTRNLILTKSGATEFTEAMARGGWLSTTNKIINRQESFLKNMGFLLPRTVGKVGATVLQPFQRGFEAALDVAGIELREALDYMCTTPERQAGVEQFINEFRGVTSSARIGVSVKERQLETTGVLAPRYNRAIAAWLFDLSRGTIRGSLARKSLAKGMAALVAMTIAIGYARGESMEEIVDHLNPIPPNSNFMTWEVAGQKVGPGSKVRSIINLFGQSTGDPEKLLSLSMENPVLRWIRGNFSPVISTGYDLLAGRDYIGDPTRDGLLSFTETVAENFMPIWTQTVLLEGGDLRGRAIRGISEFMGGRGYPDPWGKLENMRNEAAMSKYNKPYGELNRLQQKQIDEREDIKELQEQSEAESARRATGFRGEVDNFFAEGDRIEEYRTEKLWDIHNQLIKGEITQGDANSSYWELGKEIGGMYEARDINPRYEKVREYLEERATEKEKEQEGKEIYPGDKAYYEYQKLFEQADLEGWSSDEISQQIEKIWIKYPGSEEYVRELQEVGKDWPPSYFEYRRTRGKETTARGQVNPWSAVRQSLDSKTLGALNRLWYGGGQLNPWEQSRLKQLYQQNPMGQAQFNPWVRQTLRQSFENSIR